jgi:alpha-1,3-rhamnosyltransferase
LPECIRDNVEFTSSNPNAKIIFSQVLLYIDEFKKQNFLGKKPISYPNNLMDSTFTATDQWSILIQSDRITYTPSYFFHKAALAQVGNYDEDNTLVEDYPMWLKLTRAGIKLHYFHKPTVGYRIHQKAINNVGDDVLFKPSIINGYRVRKRYAHPHLPIAQIWQESWVYGVTLLFQRLGLNKNKRLLKYWYKFFTVYANPFVYVNALKKRLKSLN